MFFVQMSKIHTRPRPTAALVPALVPALVTTATGRGRRGQSNGCTPPLSPRIGGVGIFVKVL